MQLRHFIIKWRSALAGCVGGGCACVWLRHLIRSVSLRIASAMTQLFLTPQHRHALALALLLAGAMAGARADETADGAAVAPLRLSGFGTLGLTHNDSSDAGAIFSSAQKRPAGEGWSANLDSVLGLQLEWQAGENTAFVLQGVARAGDDLSPALRMFYLRQQISNDFAVRAGRIRSPLYFDSDVVEIGYAYL